jgi:hypothetical protein
MAAHYDVTPAHVKMAVVRQKLTADRSRPCKLSGAKDPEPGTSLAFVTDATRPHVQRSASQITDKMVVTSAGGGDHFSNFPLVFDTLDGARG